MFCEDHGIRRPLSSPRNPQQNGVLERKNRIFQEMDRTILKYAKLLDVYWKGVVYILNKV